MQFSSQDPKSEVDDMHSLRPQSVTLKLVVYFL
jgi:hypothetical protein